MKRIIIAGGSGLMGTTLSPLLLASDYEVIILSRSPQAKADGIANGAKIEGWDGKSADGWGHLADGAHAVINLAGENLADGRWTDERKRRIIASRVNPGNAVVEAVHAAQTKPAVVIQSSASGYYGPRGDEPVTEATPTGSDYPAQVCQQWEASTAEVESMGVRRVVVRTGLVLTRKGGALPRVMLPFQLFAGEPMGHGKQYWPWIHLHDEVAAIKFLLEHDSASGPFNLSAPNPERNGDFAKTLGRVMGRPSFMPAPAIAFKIGFGEMSTILLDGQRMLPQRLLELGFEFKFPTLRAALEDIVK